LIQFRKKACALPNLSIMIPGLEEIDPVIADEIDKAVFLDEAAGPDAGGKILERFRFADAGEGIAHDGLDQVEGAQRHLAVTLNTVAQVITELRLEDGLAVFTSQCRFPGGGFPVKTVPPRV